MQGEAQQAAVEPDRAVEVVDRERDVVDAHHARRVPAQPPRQAVAPGHVGQRLGPPHQLGAVARDQHRRRSRHRVEVAGQRLLVGAGGEEGDHVAGGDPARQPRAGRDRVEAAADADHVHLLIRARHRVGADRIPAAVLPAGVAQQHLGAVAADPHARHRGRLALHVQHGRQVHPGAAVHGPARFDLERDAPGVDAGGAQRLGQAARDRAGVLGGAGGVRRRRTQRRGPWGRRDTSSRRRGRSRAVSSPAWRVPARRPARPDAARAGETARPPTCAVRGGHGRRPGRRPRGRAGPAPRAARRSGCRACRRRPPLPADRAR